jgi:hypothetical protein
MIELTGALILGAFLIFFWCSIGVIIYATIAGIVATIFIKIADLTQYIKQKVS